MMNDTSIFSRSRRLAASFRRADGGNVAVMFAIAVLPILGFVGAAVDYTRANSARTAMQAALDTTALMLSKDAAGLSATQINDKAQKYFTALYKQHPEAQNVEISATYTTSTKDGSKIVLGAKAFMETNFMKIVGYPKIDFGTSSTTEWGSTKLRVALALDITGSMDSAGKLDAMKAAAKDLVNKLKNSAKASDDVYMAIVPFNQMVNVNTDNKNAYWLDWDTGYGSCSKSKYTTKSSCRAAGQTWTSSQVNKWKGCVTDREKDPNVNYDTLKDPPDASNPKTLFLAQDYSDCGASILPMTSLYDSKEPDLSTDATTIKGKINSLTANGSTNQAIGMQWAWLMLQSTDPFPAPKKDPDFKYTDAIILLSDGMNTKDRWYGDGRNWSRQVDDRQKLLCDNIKDKANGTTVVYTIQVNTDGDPESAVLKYCANGGNFYSSTTASGIATAFDAIGSSLVKLHIAR